MRYAYKRHLRELERKRAGVPRDPRSGGLFLDRNERPVTHSDAVIKELAKRISGVPFNLYPDVDIFYRKLVNWVGVKTSQIYITEGVSGAIKSLVETITREGDNVVFPSPTFALYPVYCKMFNLKFRTAGYDKDCRLEVDKMLGLIDDRTSMLFLPNPNVPIEGTLDLDTIGRMAKYCDRKNVFFVIDEVYFPFGGPTAIGLIDRFDNLFIMRSFSKAFGLAGIRLGYVVGNAKNIEYVSKTRTGYESNALSMEVASFFIDNYHVVDDYIKDVREGLDYLKRELEGLGLRHNGGMASNFVYVELRDKALAKRVVDKLRDRNVYVRGNWPEPYSRGISVTGAPKPVMEKFVKEFADIILGKE